MSPAPPDRGDERARVERAVDEELSYHHERTVAELTARGLSRAEAEAEAQRRFGSVRVYRQRLLRLHRPRGGRLHRRALMEMAAVSVRSAVRSATSQPAFTAGVIVVLALGLGVNAVTFALVDRLLLSDPAGLVAADELQRVVMRHGEPGGADTTTMSMAYADYQDLQGAASLAGAAAETSGPQLLGSGAGAELIRARFVTASYFTLLGVQPALGRFFTAEESERSGARLVVLGHALWQRRFAGRAEVLGQVLPIGGNRYTVVGVAPRNFTGSSVTRADVFLPLEAAADEMIGGAWQTSRGIRWVNAVVRVAATSTPAAAAEEATARHRRGHQDAPGGDVHGSIQLSPLKALRGVTARDDARVAAAAAAVALLVFAIAIANVANLFLARTLRRGHELAVRVALGGGRARMALEQAGEGAVLALGGAAAAAVIAVQGTGAVQRLLFPHIDWLETTLDARAVAFVVCAAVAGGALAAGVPAWMSTRAPVFERLRSGTQRVARARTSGQAALLVVQGALSVMLLVGAGLFVRSLSALQAVDLGVDADRVLTVGVAPGDEPLRPGFMEQLRDRVQHLPGVERLALAAGTIPFVSSWAVALRVPGLAERPRLESGGPYVHGVSAQYFQTAGTAIVAGRPFNETDRAGAPLVAIVNETMARLYWPGEPAIGQCLQIGSGSPPCATVVGVAENARRWEVVEGDTLLYYVPIEQAPESVRRAAARLVVRVRDAEDGTIARVADSIRREALALDPGLRYVGVEAMAETIAPQLRAWQLGATLFAAFGLLALVVAAVGLYSVVAFSVEGRRRELGVRAALGASTATLIRLVIGDGLRLAAAGVLLGLVLAWLAAPLAAGLLYRVAPRDPGVFATVVAVLLAAAILASAIPALRAAHADPSQSLRQE